MTKRQHAATAWRRIAPMTWENVNWTTTLPHRLERNKYGEWMLFFIDPEDGLICGKEFCPGTLRPALRHALNCLGWETKRRVLNTVLSKGRIITQ